MFCLSDNPYNTYISAANFKSPKELAKFLTIVGKNESYYISLLKEKDKYYPYINPNEETGMCNICRHLNERMKDKICNFHLIFFYTKHLVLNKNTFHIFHKYQQEYTWTFP
jgi:hypothetical protein